MKFLQSLGLLALASLSGASQVIKRATLQQVTNFGANTSGTKMYIYVPAKLATKPAIIVAVHYCTGTGPGYYQNTPYATLAEQYGFIVIYPESPYSGTCWDVSSTAALTHNGGADSNSIANMVTYTLNTYNGDASKVFVTGSSSGAMMTNVLAATYPEMFAAATVYSGVPAGCFYTGTVQGWNSSCANGQSVHTQTEWANTVFAMYPGYTGARPKMLILHGSADTTLYPQNFNETLKQWAGVFGYTYGSPAQTLAQTPSAAYTEYVYGANLAGIYGTGVGHTVPVMGDLDLAWFGITGGSASTSVMPGTTTTTSRVSSTSTTLTTTTKAATTTAPAGGSCSAKWGQCGGSGWAGATCCVSGSTCKYSNDWYSQCL